MTYQVKNYRQQGGANWVVGGTLQVSTSGTLDMRGSMTAAGPITASGAVITSDGRRIAITETTTSYTITANDEAVLCTGTFTVALYAATGSGAQHTVKNIGSGVVTVDADGSETIDGETTQSLGGNDSIRLVDGKSGAWYIL